MLQDNSITIIPLNQVWLEAPLISREALWVIRENKKNNKKTLIFYNRRGTARAWMCEDCGYFEKCPHCDIAFAYHARPTKRLVCHQCNTIAPFPIECPHCLGAKIVWVGIGIERITSDIENLLGHMYSVLRIDSDTKSKMVDIHKSLDIIDVVVATSMASTLVHPDIASVIFLSFEVNLSIPEYDMEEQLYDEILYYKKQHLPIYLQTYTPDHPLIREILTGNQRSFFDILQSERRAFSYPPFSELATIRVHHASQQTVTTMMAHISRKIGGLKWDGVFFAADHDIWEKRGGEWSQKIILKWKNLIQIVWELEVEVVRNRSVSLEWD